MTDLTNASDCSRTRIIAYWVTTAIIAAEFAVGGVMDLLRAPLFFEILKRLGYPVYFSIILGIWKVLGAVAVVVPRFPRLKEWAYAGMFFTMIGAAASHLAVGDPAVMLVAPIVFTGLVLASWALRPPPRRDDPSVALTPPKSRKLWAKTSARNRHERNETNQRPYPNSATIKENLMPRIKTVRGIENRRVVSPKEWLPPGRSFS